MWKRFNLLLVAVMLGVISAPSRQAEAEVLHNYPHWTNGSVTESETYITLWNQFDPSADAAIAAADADWTSLANRAGDPHAYVNPVVWGYYAYRPPKCAAPGGFNGQINNWEGQFGIVICGDSDAALGGELADAVIYANGATSWYSCAYVLGDTCGSSSPASHIAYAQIRINQTVWPTLSANARRDLITHEIGHALGLAHTTAGSPPSVMVATCPGGGGSYGEGMGCPADNYGSSSVSYDYWFIRWLYNKDTWNHDTLHGYCRDTGTCVWH